jgi:hypothetical protein
VNGFEGLNEKAKCLQFGRINNALEGLLMYNGGVIRRGGYKGKVCYYYYTI